MTRSLTIPALALVLLVGCSSSRPAVDPPDVNPATDPTTIGAVDEAVLQGQIQGEAAAKTGRKIGRVAGVLAAVFGGPNEESLDDALARYWLTREAVEITAEAIGTAKGATAGAKRGHVLDLQFAELHAIDGIEVLRPVPDQINVHLPESASPDLLASVAAVFADREQRAIEIEGPGDAPLDIRDTLVTLGVPAASFAVNRDDDLRGVYLRIGYKD
jgi:hypothetical protein